MHLFRACIEPKSAFGTPIKGDTLFGQLCWALRNAFGEPELTRLLDGYTDARPFCVISDAFPSGFLPRPRLPQSMFSPIDGEDAKQLKRRQWLAHEHFNLPVSKWLGVFVPDTALAGAVAEESPQPHNSISRLTGTTGKGDFAPYQESQLWFGPDRRSDASGVSRRVALDIYVVVDTDRINPSAIHTALESIGSFGFGRDASVGLGKFGVNLWESEAPLSQHGADAYLTLAPCAPQGLAWDESRCFYQPFTRFGRHGDAAVHTGRPFKSPVLLADTGAVLTPVEFDARLVVGRGIGGRGELSKAIAATVHQGYAPVVGLALPQVLSSEVSL